MNPIVENEDPEGTEVAGASRSRRAILARAPAPLSYYRLLVEHYNQGRTYRGHPELLDSLIILLRLLPSPPERLYTAKPSRFMAKFVKLGLRSSHSFRNIFPEEGGHLLTDAIIHDVTMSTWIDIVSYKIKEEAA